MERGRGGQEDRRTGGQEDRRTGGQEDRRTGGQEDRRTGGDFWDLLFKIQALRSDQVKCIQIKQIK